MAGPEEYILRLLQADSIRQPVMRSIIQALQLPPASHGLDVGCGIGIQTLLLAEAVGPAGHITGVDILPELLRYAENLVVKAGLTGRIKYPEANMNRLPFADAAFDWVWSADCAGYPAGGLQPLLKELMRVVRPGGNIILLAWSSQQVLPGYPLLEARLNATCSSYLPFLQGKGPDLHFMRALNSFRKAGLDQVEACTFVGDIQAPLMLEQRTALTSLFEMLWGQEQSGCSPEDWIDFQDLCKPDSPDFILNLPGYYAFFTYTLVRGTLPRQ